MNVTSNGPATQQRSKLQMGGGGANAHQGRRGALCDCAGSQHTRIDKLPHPGSAFNIVGFHCSFQECF